MKRFSLRLTEAEYNKLKNYCEQLQISMNDVIRHLLREWNPNLSAIDKTTTVQYPTPFSAESNSGYDDSEKTTKNSKN